MKWRIAEMLASACVVLAVAAVSVGMVAHRGGLPPQLMVNAAAIVFAVTCGLILCGPATMSRIAGVKLIAAVGASACTVTVGAWMLWPAQFRQSFLLLPSLLLPALSEELVFRRYLVRRLVEIQTSQPRWLASVTGVLAAQVCFALCHAFSDRSLVRATHGAALLNWFVVGLLLAVIVSLAGIVASTTAHVLLNIYVVVMGGGLDAGVLACVIAIAVPLVLYARSRRSGAAVQSWFPLPGGLDGWHS